MTSLSAPPLSGMYASTARAPSRLRRVDFVGVEARELADDLAVGGLLDLVVGIAVRALVRLRRVEHDRALGVAQAEAQHAPRSHQRARRRDELRALRARQRLRERRVREHGFDPRVRDRVGFARGLVERALVHLRLVLVRETKPRRLIGIALASTYQPNSRSPLARHAILCSIGGPRGVLKPRRTGPDSGSWPHAGVGVGRPAGGRA